MTRVVWLGDRRMCLDQHMLDGLLKGPAWEHERGEWSAPLEGDGAVVIVPARFYSPAMVNHATSLLAWCVVVLTSDEESLFDHEQLAHPNMRVWVMTPRPGRHAPGYRFLGEGFHRDTPAHVVSTATVRRSIDVSFAGQVTHERREQMMAAAEQLTHLSVVTLPTSGFMQGLPLPQYVELLTDSKIVLCPSGPATPDSFRTYEALEAGCVPIVDGHCPGYPEDGYWQLAYGGDVPFPVIEDWADLPAVVDDVLADWRGWAARCQAWWGRRKQATYDRLVADVCEISGLSDPRHDELTVVIPTSPTPETPAEALQRIRTVVAAAREHLPTAPMVITADGVRAEQRHLAGAYTEHLQALAWACLHEWHDTQLAIAEHHVHQAGVTRAALDLVRTPTILFLEHDFELLEWIPFEQLVEVVRSANIDLVRLGLDHEDRDYAQLMLDPEPVPVFGLPIRRTAQWSQRPHVASTAWYRGLLAKYFGRQSRTMIEDVMYGVVFNAWEREGEAGLRPFRLALYCPPGGIVRCRHLDGRKGEPKYPMVYAYPGPTPEGAPAPTVQS